MSSLSEVASEAGVSPRTVARVLRGDLRESWASTAARADRIREIAAKMGYKTNSSARAVRSGKFTCVGLVLSCLNGRSHLPEQLLDGIHDEVQEQGYHLTLGRLPDSELSDIESFPKILREWCCDGLLVNYTDRIPAAMLKHLHRQTVPSLWLNARLPYDCLYYDDEAAGHGLTVKLIEMGHRRIEYIDFTSIEPADDQHYSRVDRYAGYQRAMREAGLEPGPRERHSGVPHDERLPRTMATLRQPDRPTAVITYDTPSRVLYAAALLGLSVPGDLSIASFSSHEPHPAYVKGEEFIGVDFTTMTLPTRQAGRRAVSHLLEKIARPGRRSSPVVLKPMLQDGDTCAPPSAPAS